MGAKKPRRDNLDKYNKADESGEIVLDVEICDAPDPEDAHSGMDIFLSWLLNVSFSRASATLRRLKPQEEAKEDADLWDIARRDVRKYFVHKKPNRPEAHSRGKTALASSWIAELIAGSGIDSDITDFSP